ncbi:hypothetical protein [Roseomonas sp. WA12]
MRLLAAFLALAVGGCASQMTAQDYALQFARAGGDFLAYRTGGQMSDSTNERAWAHCWQTRCVRE